MRIWMKYRIVSSTIGDTMTEPTIPELDDETDDFPIHTCACGEQHRYIAGQSQSPRGLHVPEKEHQCLLLWISK